MIASCLRAMALACAFAAITLAQSFPTTPYRDYWIGKIKPEKMGAFDALARKMADANRRMKGDHFIASSVEYGDHGTVMYVSPRENFGGVQKGGEVFMKAINDALTPAGAMKMFGEMGTTMIGSRAEVRRLRPDLSINMPGPEDLNRMIGNARYIRITTTRVRPGKMQVYIDNSMMLKAALEKSGSSRGASLVAQGVLGQYTGSFYSTRLLSSMADLDEPMVQVRQLLGDEDYKKYAQALSDSVMFTESVVARIVPEWSNPPAEVAAVAPEFWTPKPKPAAARPKAEEKK